MPSRRHTVSLSRDDTLADPARATAAPLGRRLSTIVDDRVSTSEELVLATCRELQAWILEQPETWDWERAGLELEAGLAAFAEEQGWRGPCAVWIDSLRRAWHHGRAQSRQRAEVAPRAVLAEEVALWLSTREPGFESAERSASPSTAGSVAPSNDDPLGSGGRWPSREELARHAAALLERGEVIVVNAYSNTAALALEAAQRAGHRPHAIVAEALPNRAGQRMAARLARAGVPVTLCYDAALPANLPRADRVWLSTEAIGSHGLLARVGTRLLVEEADRLEVPVQVLATSDKLMPGGELSFPRFCERDTSLLWSDAPQGVRLECQLYEAVSLDALARFVTEIGAETATALHLRALRVEAASTCAPETTSMDLNT